MKVFYAMHSGVWLGGNSVVVAPDADTARALVEHALNERNLKAKIDEIVEIPLDKAANYMLFDGDY